MESPTIAGDFARLSLHKDNVFGDFENFTSGKQSSADAVLTAAVRAHHPDLNLTKCMSYNVDILGYAAAGYAKAELDSIEDSLLRTRYYFPGAKRQISGGLADALIFSKYKYTWMNNHFIVYLIGNSYYILAEPGESETKASHSELADKLIHACGEVQSALDHVILVYDGVWTKSRALYNEVQKATWDDVILNDEMKTTLMETIERFFDSEDQYHNLGVPWKRGLIFWGPPGNGKTISLKAVMKSLSVRETPVPTLYVRSMGYGIRDIFQKARQMSPCLLIIEDIDTQLSSGMRSYFFNELDGLENNDGVLMIATTNHLDRLDPGLVKRPSRFDRKYLFPLPSFEERVMYCDYWRAKLRSNAALEFPSSLCSAIAKITSDFSFAYLKEAFVASLLSLAHQAGGPVDDSDDNPDIDDLPLWIELQKQITLLREDIEKSKSADPNKNASDQLGAQIGPGQMRPSRMNRGGMQFGPGNGFMPNQRSDTFGSVQVPTNQGFNKQLGVSGLSGREDDADIF
ncbi:MAG: hypothetical protein Q9227_006275 [Pyrenula ochraceoflavens]